MAANDVSVATVVGRMTSDAEIKDIDKSGAQFTLAKFTLACNQWQKNGEHTSFFRVEAWGSLATTIQQYTAKGKQLLVVGQLRIDEYEGRDGTTKQSTVIKADKIQLLGEKVSGSQQAERPQAKAIAEQDIPF